jgi:hypothetical protein
VVYGAYKRLEVSAGFTALKPIRELFSELSAANSGRKRLDLSPGSKGEKG